MKFNRCNPLGDLLDHPIIEFCDLPVVGVSIPTDEFLIELFGKKTKGLKMWGGKGDQLHWLACRNGIQLHTDPGYSRYAYQLVIRNDGWNMTGYDQLKVTALPPGTAYCLDTYSPHQLVKTECNYGRFFCAVGFDGPDSLPVSEFAERLMEYAQRDSDHVRAERSK